MTCIVSGGALNSTHSLTLPCPPTARSKTQQRMQAIRLHGVYKYGPRIHPLHQKLNRRQRCRRHARYSTLSAVCQRRQKRFFAQSVERST